MTKVSIYMDEDVWKRFKKLVVARTGDMKALSKEVQKLVKESLVEDTLLNGFRSLCPSIEQLPSARSVEAVIPSVPASAGRTLREIRNERLAKGVSGQ